MINFFLVDNLFILDEGDLRRFNIVSAQLTETIIRLTNIVKEGREEKDN